jgi:hypothetical protein
LRSAVFVDAEEKLTMNRIRNGVLAAITVLAVAVAGGLLLSRAPQPDSLTVRDVANASTAPANGVRGPGIPPAPGASQNAPPNPNSNAPTANLKQVANNLQLRVRSVSAVVTLPAGLNLTHPVSVSILFGSQRVTQPYNNAAGNRFPATFPANDGTQRREEVIISLAEDVGGDHALYAVRQYVDIEPLYDISVGPLSFTLIEDCDLVGDSEVNIRWFQPKPGFDTDHAYRSLSGGETVTIPNFAKTLPEVGASKVIYVPTVAFIEEDFNATDAYAPFPDRRTTTFLPGPNNRTVTATLQGQHTDDYCAARISFQITYALRQYPNL